MSVRDLLRDAQKQLAEAKGRFADLARSLEGARDDLKRLAKVVEYIGGRSAVPSVSIPVPLHPKPGGIEVIEERDRRESGEAPQGSTTDSNLRAQSAAANPVVFPCNGQCGDPECHKVFDRERELRGHLAGKRTARKALLREPR